MSASDGVGSGRDRDGSGHPKLHHLERAAFAREILRVEFFVNDALSSSHPLHISRSNLSAAATGVAMFHLAFLGRPRCSDHCTNFVQKDLAGFGLAAIAPFEIFRRISQNFSPAGVTSPFVARAMPTDATSVVPVSGR